MDVFVQGEKRCGFWKVNKNIGWGKIRIENSDDGELTKRRKIVSLWCLAKSLVSVCNAHNYK